jgi:hypothetical protein
LPKGDFSFKRGVFAVHVVKVLYVGFNEKFALHDFAVDDCDKCLNEVIPYLNKVRTFYLVLRFDVTFSDITVALHLVACVKGGL